MKRFKMVAYSGGVIEPLFWDRMVIDVSGIRASARLPALREHIRDRAVGVVDQTNKRDGKFNAEGYFLSTKDGQEVKQLASEGFPWQASVGIFPLKVEKISRDEVAQVNGATFKGPGVIWRESNVREISFVSLGMDADTSVAVAASAARGVSKMRATETFSETMNRFLSEGHSVRKSIELAAEANPSGYKECVQSLFVGIGEQAQETDASAELDSRARALAAERSISYAEALDLVLTEDTNLAQQYFSTF